MTPLRILAVGVRTEALPPCADTVAALVELRAGRIQSAPPALLANDPGALLAYLSLPSRLAVADIAPPENLELTPAVLTELLEALRGASSAGFADWSEGVAREVYRASLAIAWTARELAANRQQAASAAEYAGRFALLGPMAVHAIPSAALESPTPGKSSKSARSAQLADTSELTRALVRRWKLPTWLARTLLCLDLEHSVASQFDADPAVVQIVQAAVATVRELGDWNWLETTPVHQLASQSSLIDPPELETIRTVVEHAAESQPAQNRAPPALLWRLADATLGERRVDAELAPLEREAERLRRHLQETLAATEAAIEQRKLSGLAEFAAGAGHEINNPLAVISAQAQQLLKDEENLERAKALERIITQSRRIHGLLRDLMVFARPPQLQLKPASLARIVRETVEGQTGFALERGVRLETHGLSGKHSVHVDAALVEIAIGCLLRNALAAAPAEGWVRVGITESAPGDFDVIVEDNGPGLTCEQSAHMFEPFYSGRNAGRGPGLGLPKAWRIAQLHGGSIRCDSLPGQPTRFTLRLPAAPEKPKPSADGRPRQSRSRHTRHVHSANGNGAVRRTTRPR